MQGMTEQMLEIHGKDIVLRRPSTNSAPTDITVRAAIRQYQPVELQGGIIQGDRRVVVRATELAVSSWPLPIKKGDQIIDGTTVYVVQAVDAVELFGLVVRYNLVVRG